MNASTETNELLVPVSDRLAGRCNACIIRITDDHDPKHGASSVMWERRHIDAAGVADAIHTCSEEEQDQHDQPDLRSSREDQLHVTRPVEFRESNSPAKEIQQKPRRKK